MSKTRGYENLATKALKNLKIWVFTELGERYDKFQRGGGKRGAMKFSGSACAGGGVNFLGFSKEILPPDVLPKHKR